MRVRDCMATDLPAVGPKDTLGMAATAMTKHKVGAVPVLDGPKIVGIITDWDVMLGVADADGGGPNASDRLCSELMSTKLVTCPPDAWIGEASQVMALARRHHLIVEENGDYLGMMHVDVDWTQLSDGIESPTASFLATA